MVNTCCLKLIFDISYTVHYLKFPNMVMISDSNKILEISAVSKMTREKKTRENMLILKGKNGNVYVNAFQQ